MLVLFVQIRVPVLLNKQLTRGRERKHVQEASVEIDSKYKCWAKNVMATRQGLVMPWNSQLWPLLASFQF